MKKLIITLICTAMVLCSCGKDNPENSSQSSATNTNKYVNGTYSVAWSNYVDGWKEFVTLSIENDKISILQYDAKNENGEMISSNAEADDKYIENNYSFGLPEYTNSEKFKKIIEQFEKDDKNINKMECVAGATKSSKKFKLLTEKILTENALSGSSDIAYVNNYGDGIYIVEEAHFNSGWKDFVELTVKNGKTSITKYDSYDKDGNLKSEDEDIKTRMISYSKAKNRGEICPETYGKELVEKFNQCNNNPSEIETVAGATISSDIFKNLAEKALNNAAERGKEFDSISKYKDGSYSAEMTEFEDGWKAFVTIEIKDDVIKVTEFDSIDLMGNLKSKSEEQKVAMMNGNAINNLPETFPKQYCQDIISSFSQGNSDVLEMENVSGATLSTNNFKLMVGEILRTCAIKGEPYQIKVEPYHK